LITPKQTKKQKPNELMPKELKESAQKVNDPFANIQDDGAVSDFDYGAFENVTIRNPKKKSLIHLKLLHMIMMNRNFKS
jgi:hypothetical protein